MTVKTFDFGASAKAVEKAIPGLVVMENISVTDGHEFIAVYSCPFSGKKHPVTYLQVVFFAGSLGLTATKP